jgi:hypothetical protein
VVKNSRQVPEWLLRKRRFRISAPLYSVEALADLLPERRTPLLRGLPEDLSRSFQAPVALFRGPDALFRATLYQRRFRGPIALFRGPLDVVSGTCRAVPTTARGRSGCLTSVSSHLTSRSGNCTRRFGPFHASFSSPHAKFRATHVPFRSFHLFHFASHAAAHGVPRRPCPRAVPSRVFAS